MLVTNRTFIAVSWFIEEVKAIKVGQPKAPLRAVTAEDKKEVKQGHAEPKKDPKGRSFCFDW